jgi:hypothetical protein
LKNFINESHRLKEFQNDKQRKKKIDEYFAKLKKQNQAQIMAQAMKQMVEDDVSNKLGDSIKLGSG